MHYIDTVLNPRATKRN